MDSIKKQISLKTATFIVIANMIGTGVFTSLGFQTFDIKTGFALISLWVVGGLVALSGSLVYSKLATAFPRSGGEYNLLSEIYHPSIGFIAGWVSITVGFAAPVALAAMALGKYTHEVYPAIDALKVGIVVILLTSIIHSVSVKYGSLFQNSFTIFKIVLIFILIIGGLLFAKAQPISFLPTQADINSIFSMPYGVSLIFVSYTYSGWNAATYIAGEIMDPDRNIPKALLYGTLFVMLLYIGLNFIFLYATPFSEIPGTIEIGLKAANHIFGVTGGKIIGISFSIALIASISSMIFAGPRVTQVMGEDYAFFKFASIRNSSGAPYVATLVQMTITLLLLLTATFEAILAYVGFTLALISLLTVVGIFKIKFDKKENLIFYYIAAIIFTILSLWMIYFTINDKPKESLLGFATVASGLIFYYLSPKKKKDFLTDSIN